METLLLSGIGALLLLALFVWLNRSKGRSYDKGFTGNVDEPQFAEDPAAARVVTNTAPAHTPTRTDLKKEVRVMLAAGNKIDAVRLVRERTSMALKEAKDLVDAIESGASSSNASPASGSGRSAPATDMDTEARRLLAKRKKIEAIKLVRERTGLGLKEAKDYVEQL